MKFALKVLMTFVLVLLLVYALGPAVDRPQLDPALPEVAGLTELEAAITAVESRVPNLKPGNASRIIWAGDSIGKTPYAIVYLHGFSASPQEGEPLHRRLAARYGANLYLPRLYGHGMDTSEAFLDLTGDKLLATAKEALAIGLQLGDSVILMSCSTGGTLSLFLAAHHPEVHSLILYSPNIDFADPKSDMITKPWGLPLTRLVFDGKYRSYEASPEVQKYWTNRYRLEGLIQVKALVEATMKAKTFHAVRQPVFLGYYYRSEDEQDDIVSVPAMRMMFGELGTPPTLKREKAFPDARSHVINAGLMSRDLEGVWRETIAFCEETLGMKPVMAEP